MEELLGLCDRLNLLLAKVPSARPSKLHLQGLGLKLDNNSIPNGNGASGNGLFVRENGHATRSDQHGDDEEEPSPTTPKVDKGKGRAEPEPEQHEPVLSPTHFLVGEEYEDEDGQRFLHQDDLDDSVTSPTHR
jgi:protein phosphatase 1 regulatory subunit 37